MSGEAIAVWAVEELTIPLIGSLVVKADCVSSQPNLSGLLCEINVSRHEVHPNQ